MCCDYTNVSLEVLGYELSSSINTQRFIRLRILIFAEPKLNKVTLNRRLRREPIIAAQATKVRHAGQSLRPTLRPYGQLCAASSVSSKATISEQFSI